MTRERANSEASTASGGKMRGHLTEAAYDFVKGRLLEGFYGADGRISPEDVMDALSISRQPVMDALRRLSAERFVKVVPQSGCLVSLPQPQEFADFMYMLASIEGSCIELAAKRASDEEIARLAEIVSRFEEEFRGATARRSEADIGRAYRMHNREFHHHLYSMAHSETVASIALGMTDRADFYIANSTGAVTFARRFEDAVEEHRRIAEVLSWREPSLARTLIESHVLSFIATIETPP